MDALLQNVLASTYNMVIVYGIFVIILLSSTNSLNEFGGSLPCYVIEFKGTKTFNVIVDIMVNNENYEVILDTGSSAFFLLTKYHTMWKYDDPESIKSDIVLQCDIYGDLISPIHTEIDPESVNPRCEVPKYLPDPATDITTYGEDGSCRTNHLTFANCWLTVIWNVYNETVTLDQSNFVIPVGGVWKVVTSSKSLDMFDGTLGLAATFEDETNQPNFLFFIRKHLQTQMFGLYLGTHYTESQFSLGRPLDGIDRSKLMVIPAVNDYPDPTVNQLWAIQPIIKMRFFRGGRYEEKQLNNGNSFPVIIDTGSSAIHLPEELNREWYQTLGIDYNDEYQLLETCDYWRAVNATLDMCIDNNRCIQLTYVNIIRQLESNQNVCFPIIGPHPGNQRTYILLGYSLFKTYYVEFHFENKETREMKFGLMRDIKV